MAWRLLVAALILLDAVSARAQKAFEFRRSTDNVVVATMDSGGKLSVSSVAVPGSYLAVTDPNVAADAYSFAVTTAANKSVYHLYVATNGNVGILTSSPSSNLTVAGTVRSTTEPVWRLVGKNRSNVSNCNSVSEINLAGASYTIPANSPDSEWLYRWEGTLTNNSGAGDVYRLDVFFNAVSTGAFNAEGNGVTNDPVVGRAWIVKRDNSSAVLTVEWQLGGSPALGETAPGYAEKVVTGINWGVANTINMGMLMDFQSLSLCWTSGMLDLDAR